MKFLNNNKEQILKLNIFCFYFFFPIIPVMVPLFKIEPLFKCQYTDISLHTQFHYCNKERICNFEFYEIDNENSYTSFKYSYYDKMLRNYERNSDGLYAYFPNKFEICKKFPFLIYFNFFYFSGTFIGNIIHDKLFNYMNLKICFFILIQIWNSFYIIGYILDKFFLNFDTHFSLFALTSGINFYFISVSLIEEYAQCSTFIKLKIQNQQFSNFLNVLYTLGAIFHIMFFYFFKNWKYNFCFFMFFMNLNLICYLFYKIPHVYKKNMNSKRRFQNNENILKNSYNISLLKSVNDIDLMQQNIIETILIKKRISEGEAFLNKEHKIKKKNKYYIDLFIIFILSSGYNTLNFKFEKLSYKAFDLDINYIFLDSLVLYFTEFIALISYDYHIYKIEGIIYLTFPLLIGIGFIMIEISDKILVSTFFLFLTKFFLMYLNNFMINEFFSKNKNIVYKQKLVSKLIRIGAIFSSFYSNYYTHPFLFTSVAYFLSFFAIFKTIKNK